MRTAFQSTYFILLLLSAAVLTLNALPPCTYAAMLAMQHYLITILTVPFFFSSTSFNMYVPRQRVHLHGGAPAEAKGKGSSTKPKDMTKKAVLLSGPPGIGKTSAAHIVCREAGFQAVEVNASETRNKADKGAQGGVAGKLSNAIKELSTNTTIGWVGGRPDAHQQSSKVCVCGVL